MENVQALAATLEKVVVPLIESDTLGKTLRRRYHNLLNECESVYLKQVDKLERREVYLGSLEALRALRKKKKAKRLERGIVCSLEKRAYRKIDQVENLEVTALYEQAARVGIEKNKLKFIEKMKLQELPEHHQDFLRIESHITLHESSYGGSIRTKTLLNPVKGFPSRAPMEIKVSRKVAPLLVLAKVKVTQKG